MRNVAVEHSEQDSREIDELEFVEYLEELPTKPPDAPEKPLAPEVRELMAQSVLRVLEAQKQADAFGTDPDEAWKWLPALFGLPVEPEVEELKALPWASNCLLGPKATLR